jgi:hypothetical protein
LNTAPSYAQLATTLSGDSRMPVLRSGRSGGEERPSPAKTIDLVSELNRIWDDPRPAADKPLEPPATPKVE